MSERILEMLTALRDEGYRTFQCRLMPTVDPAAVLGVRTPDVRALAKLLAGTPEACAFLTGLPHRYYEENNLHAFLLSRLRDFDACVRAVDAFLPYVDNWATCDSMSPPVFARHRPELLDWIRRWLADGRVYTVRFGLGMLMGLYLDEAFDPAYLALAAGVRSEEYYVNMMSAWYFATALAKRYAETLPYLEERRLALWVHNKTIRKAVESHRVPPEHKAYLHALILRQPDEA